MTGNIYSSEIQGLVLDFVVDLPFQKICLHSTSIMGNPLTLPAMLPNFCIDFLVISEQAILVLYLGPPGRQIWL